MSIDAKNQLTLSISTLAGFSRTASMIAQFPESGELLITQAKADSDAKLPQVQHFGCLPRTPTLGELHAEKGVLLTASSGQSTIGKPSRASIVFMSPSSIGDHRQSAVAPQWGWPSR